MYCSVGSLRVDVGGEIGLVSGPGTGAMGFCGAGGVGAAAGVHLELAMTLGSSSRWPLDTGAGPAPGAGAGLPAPGCAGVGSGSIGPGSDAGPPTPRGAGGVIFTSWPMSSGWPEELVPLTCIGPPGCNIGLYAAVVTPSPATSTILNDWLPVRSRSVRRTCSGILPAGWKRVSPVCSGVSATAVHRPEPSLGWYSMRNDATSG